MFRPLRCLINKKAFRENISIAKKLAPKSEIMAVMKANAYGHGFNRLIDCLDNVDSIALLELENAIYARDHGFNKPIIMLQGFYNIREISFFSDYSLIPVIYNYEQLKMLSSLKLKKSINVYIKFNSGMNRLGFRLKDFNDIVLLLKKCQNIRNFFLMSHFADADGQSGVDWQLKLINNKFINTSKIVSLANSAALIRYPHTHFDSVRPGIMLYGISPFDSKYKLKEKLNPVMTLVSKIINIQKVKKGEKIGYGSYYKAKKNMIIGVVSCGYADGYPRHAKNGTPVMIGDRKSKIVGRVSMDQLTIDLTNLPETNIYDDVVLWGKKPLINRIADFSDTISYDLLTGIAPRVPFYNLEELD